MSNKLEEQGILAVNTKDINPDREGQTNPGADVAQIALTGGHHHRCLNLLEAGRACPQELRLQTGWG